MKNWLREALSTQRTSKRRGFTRRQLKLVGIQQKYYGSGQESLLDGMSRTHTNAEPRVLTPSDWGSR